MRCPGRQTHTADECINEHTKPLEAEIKALTERLEAVTPKEDMTAHILDIKLQIKEHKKEKEEWKNRNERGFFDELIRIKTEVIRILSAVSKGGGEKK